MNFRDEFARVIAGDPRYSIDAYEFIVAALSRARRRKLAAAQKEQDTERPKGAARGARGPTPRSKKKMTSGHVSGRELCEAVRDLAVREYGSLAATVLGHWGVHSTADIGDVVFNMIAAGGLEKTPSDSRSDFDNVFDFETALKPRSLLAADDLG